MVGKLLVRYAKYYRPITAIYIAPEDDSIYLSIRYNLRNYLFVSKDSGENWVDITPEYYKKKQERIDDILHVFGKKDFPQFKGLITQYAFFISNDNGQKWERIEYPNSIKVFMVRHNPFVENEFILASFDGLYFTDNYGKDLRNITEIFRKDEESPTNFYIKDMEFSKDPGVLYFISYDSLYQSLNGGLAWSKVLTPRKFYYQIEIDPEDSMHIYTGISNGGILESFDGGLTWDYLDKRLPLNYQQNLRCIFLKISPLNRNLIIAAIEQEDYRTVNMRSIDGGNTWERIELEEELDPGTVIKFEKGIIYLGISTGSVFISKDDGLTWKQLNFDIGRLVK